VIPAEQSDRESAFLVRSDAELPAGDGPAEHPDLEDLLLTYDAPGPPPPCHHDRAGDAR
jgi:hypothetical protein